MDTWQFWIAFAGLGFTIVASVVGAVFRLTWWLGKQFTAVKETYASALQAHEAQDEKRHVENLERFSNINVALARIRTGRRANSGGDARS
jgi:hypothetical protein